MPDDRAEIAREVLLETAERVAPDIPRDLITKLYEIQVRFQFEQDSSTRVRLMEQAIDEFVSSEHSSHQEAEQE